MRTIRILFLSDTHLGFDLPARPRVERRRRGPDFFASFERALAPALRGEVDLVIHGGDLFFRSRVPPRLVAMTFEPLKRVAESGVPVCVVPGNHERSRIPHPLLALHPRVFIFDRPRTYVFALAGRRLALAGFPYCASGVREAFPDLVEATGWRAADADARLLAIHHCVEGATVGPSDYMFRGGDDVVRTADLPRDFAAVLSGHIHRAQRLSRDLQGRPLETQVLYPGSTERTSFAEMNEPKGYLILEVDGGCGPRGRVVSARFRRLATRPMARIDLAADGLPATRLAAAIRERAWRLPPDAVLRIGLTGHISDEALRVVGAGALRSLLPRTMNVSVALADAKPRRKLRGVTAGRRPKSRSSAI